MKSTKKRLNGQIKFEELGAKQCTETANAFIIKKRPLVERMRTGKYYIGC